MFSCPLGITDSWHHQSIHFESVGLKWSFVRELFTLSQHVAQDHSREQNEALLPCFYGQ